MSWQPTPQYGQTLFTLRSGLVVKTLFSSTSVAGISAPVGQACTHSPQATQVDCAHRVVEVEHDLLVMAAAGHADDVVDLHLAAGADAEIALDAGVEIDRHRHVAAVWRRHFDGLALGEAAGLDLLPLGDLPELAVRVVRDLEPRLVGDE